MSNAYNTLVNICKNESVYSSYVQNSVQRKHNFTGVINDQHFDLSFVGSKPQGLDKIASAVAKQFGVDGSLTNKANADKLSWKLQCWAPEREVIRLKEGIQIQFESEAEGQCTVVCMKREPYNKDSDEERKEPEEIARHTGENYADAEHNLAVQVLSSADYCQKYNEKIATRASRAEDPEFDTMADFGWSYHDECEGGEDDEEEGEHCKELMELCEAREINAPEWRMEIEPKEPKEGYTRGVLCMIKINTVSDSKEEAAKGLLEKIDNIKATPVALKEEMTE